MENAAAMSSAETRIMSSVYIAYRTRRLPGVLPRRMLVTSIAGNEYNCRLIPQFKRYSMPRGRTKSLVHRSTAADREAC